MVPLKKKKTEREKTNDYENATCLY